MPEPTERVYHVGLAVASLEDGLFQPPLREALTASWQAGTSVARYGRTWHLARIHRQTSSWMTGQIGFVGDNGVQTMFFDHSVKDFVTGDAPSGILVPFAVRLRDGVIAYQLRPGLVREASFTGALQALWNAPGREFVWVIRQAVESRTWEEWRRDVEKITGFNIRLERPNPHYGQDDLIEDAVEGIRLEYLRLTGAAQQAGINQDADLFRQAVNHVLREYGRAAIHGVDPRGEESTWVKLKGMAGSVTARLKVRSVGPPEIAESELVSVLESALEVQAAADLRGLGDEREEV